MLIPPHWGFQESLNPPMTSVIFNVLRPGADSPTRASGWSLHSSPKELPTRLGTGQKGLPDTSGGHSPCISPSFRLCHATVEARHRRCCTADCSRDGKAEATRAQRDSWAPSCRFYSLALRPGAINLPVPHTSFICKLGQFRYRIRLGCFLQGSLDHLPLHDCHQHAHK